MVEKFSNCRLVTLSAQYIIAKQLRLRADERGYEEPPQNPTDDDYFYWIIEIDKHEVKGPLTLKELEN